MASASRTSSRITNSVISEAHSHRSSPWAELGPVEPWAVHELVVGSMNETDQPCWSTTRPFTVGSDTLTWEKSTVPPSRGVM